MKITDTPVDDYRKLVYGKDKERREFSEVEAMAFVDPVRFTFALFVGRARKPRAYYRYRTLESMESALADAVEEVRRSETAKAERKADKSKLAKLPNPLKVGDVLHYSWGYDQTNAEFFEVIESKGQFVTVREIGAKHDPARSQGCGSMAEYVIANPGVFLDNAKPLRKRVQHLAESQPYLKMPHGIATPHDVDRAVYSSWYA